SDVAVDRPCPALALDRGIEVARHQLDLGDVAQRARQLERRATILGDTGHLAVRLPRLIEVAEREVHVAQAGGGFELASPVPGEPGELDRASESVARLLGLT